MIRDLIESELFKKMEQDYKFLSRAREKFYLLENDPYVILDLETTGLEAANSEIIEIAALKVEKKEIKDIFNQLIKPKNPIPAEIISITGITPEMIEEAPALDHVLNPFLKFIEGSTLIIHNADFDLSFINHHISALKNEAICTLKVSRYLLPNLSSHKLASLARYFNIPVKNSHRALGDVETLYELWFKLIPLLKEKGILSKEDLLKALG